MAGGGSDIRLDGSDCWLIPSGTPFVRPCLSRRWEIGSRVAALGRVTFVHYPVVSLAGETGK